MIQSILRQRNILHHSNEGITICTIKDQHEGIDLVAALLYAIVDVRTVLYLSGGKTTKALYKKIADEEQLHLGAVGQVDERYGESYHENSNQRMIKETGLLRYFEMRGIPFYPMLNSLPLRGGSDDMLRKEVTESYDEKIRSLHATFQKSIAILGIGSDGHTAGIAGNRPNFINPLFDHERKHSLVSEFDDKEGYFKERVTMTFLGLSMLDVLLVLVFGEDKQQALQLLFESGSEEEIPARFYKRPDIAPKTVIITDQQV